jgi:hypothetical protein
VPRKHPCVFPVQNGVLIVFGLREGILAKLFFLFGTFLRKSTILQSIIVGPFTFFHHPTRGLLLGFMHEHQHPCPVGSSVLGASLVLPRRWGNAPPLAGGQELSLVLFAVLVANVAEGVCAAAGAGAPVVSLLL